MTLYTKVPARITDLREFTDNILKPQGFGSDSADVYRAYLAFKFFPCKLKRGDFIRIPWGDKPNTYCPPDRELGPLLWIDTPLGLTLFEYENGGYTDGIYVLEKIGNEWRLSGPNVDFIFDTDNPLNEIFPAGFNFHKVTGWPQDYEILRFQNQLDDRGHYHHTRAEMELYVPHKANQ